MNLINQIMAFFLLLSIKSFATERPFLSCTEIESLVPGTFLFGMREGDTVINKGIITISVDQTWPPGFSPDDCKNNTGHCFFSKFLFSEPLEFEEGFVHEGIVTSHPLSAIPCHIAFKNKDGLELLGLGIFRRGNELILHKKSMVSYWFLQNLEN